MLRLYAQTFCAQIFGKYSRQRFLLSEPISSFLVFRDRLRFRGNPQNLSNYVARRLLIF